MSSTKKKPARWFDVMYWRCIGMGAATPPDGLWRWYFIALWAVFFIFFPLINSSVASRAGEDVEVWRAYLSWSLSGISLFLVMPMAILALYGHYNRDRIDPELIRQHQYEPKEMRRSISLGLAGAAAGPPIVRYILSIFGWEL